MSSEESGEDDGEEVIITKPLPWLSPHVSHFFRKLDEAALKGKSPQARRQVKKRKKVPLSSRRIPSDDYPSWIFQ